MPRVRSAAGFSLIEVMIATGILLAISTAVTQALLQMSNSQRTISNRTEMHAGVRSATELLQQEIGQAGRIALPGTATLTSAVSAGAQTVGVTIGGAASVSGIFVNEWLSIDGGTSRESVQVTTVNSVSHTFTATFVNSHAAGAAINVYGGFPSGIVPPYTNGSDATHLKLFGDINGDGSMVFVEYTCDTTNGYLYRNEMAYDAASKPATTSSMVLLNNVQANPLNTACFTYMPTPIPTVSGFTDAGCGGCAQEFVLDVAITLTVQTQQIDPITRVHQTETKALLNVSPRNVFDVWQLASFHANDGTSDRIQVMPATVVSLLPN